MENIMQCHSLNVQTHRAENVKTLRQKCEALCDHHELQHINASVSSGQGGILSELLSLSVCYRFVRGEMKKRCPKMPLNLSFTLQRSPLNLWL